jgi:hypothetical protein
MVLRNVFASFGEARAITARETCHNTLRASRTKGEKHEVTHAVRNGLSAFHRLWIEPRLSQRTEPDRAWIDPDRAQIEPADRAPDDLRSDCRPSTPRALVEFVCTKVRIQSTTSSM